jgi:hypothetical protein
MAKEKLKLSLEQDVEGAVALTTEEAADLSDLIASASKEAETATDDKKEGRVVLEVNSERITISVTKVKKEKEEDSEDEK